MLNNIINKVICKHEKEVNDIVCEIGKPLVYEVHRLLPPAYGHSGAAICTGCKKSLRPTSEACYRC